MLGSFRNRRAGVLIWALMAALVVGLAGFGIGVGGGIGGSNVANVGGLPITADDYARAMQQELRALTQQIGRDLAMTEARQYGVDRMVLARLVNDAALDDEAAAPRRLHRRRGRPRPGRWPPPPSRAPTASSTAPPTPTPSTAPASRPPSSRHLRDEATRDLVAAGVQAPAAMPDTAALTVLDFLGEKRSFDWLRLDASLLPSPIRAPTDAELSRRARRPRRRPLHPPRDPPRSPTPASPPRPSPPASRSPRPNSAPPTTPTSPASRPPSAAPSTASASPPTPTPPPPNPGSTPMR